MSAKKQCFGNSLHRLPFQMAINVLSFCRTFSLTFGSSWSGSTIFLGHCLSGSWMFIMIDGVKWSSCKCPAVCCPHFISRIFGYFKLDPSRKSFLLVKHFAITQYSIRENSIHEIFNLLPLNRAYSLYLPPLGDTNYLDFTKFELDRLRTIEVVYMERFNRNNFRLIKKMPNLRIISFLPILLHSDEELTHEKLYLEDIVNIPKTVVGLYNAMPLCQEVLDSILTIKFITQLSLINGGSYALFDFRVKNNNLSSLSIVSNVPVNGIGDFTLKTSMQITECFSPLKTLELVGQRCKKESILYLLRELKQLSKITIDVYLRGRDFEVSDSCISKSVKSLTYNSFWIGCQYWHQESTKKVIEFIIKSFPLLKGFDSFFTLPEELQSKLDNHIDSNKYN